MLNYFPEVYEDELLYSVFARYHAHTGSGVLKSTANELFAETSNRLIDLFFVNKLNPDVQERLCKNSSLDDILMNHTLFPY